MRRIFTTITILTLVILAGCASIPSYVGEHIDITVSTTEMLSNYDGVKDPLVKRAIKSVHESLLLIKRWKDGN